MYPGDEVGYEVNMLESLLAHLIILDKIQQRIERPFAILSEIHLRRIKKIIQEKNRKRKRKRKKKMRRVYLRPQQM